MKEKILSFITNKKLVVGALVFILGIVNYILSSRGLRILPISNDDLNTAVSDLFAIGSTLYLMYKNWSVTSVAQKSDELIKLVKEGKVAEREIQKLIDKVK